jgi:hypothetical protein
MTATIQDDIPDKAQVHAKAAVNSGAGEADKHSVRSGGPAIESWEVNHGRPVKSFLHNLNILR